MSVIEGFDKVVEKLKPHSLKTIKITASIEAPKHSWSSKFAGLPYWPLGKAYPRTNEGEELLLLAQINFEELPTLEGYPTTGIVQFFIADDDMYGLSFDRPIEDLLANPDTYQVIYHPEVIKDESLLDDNLPLADGDSYLPVAREYSLLFAVAEELASPTDYRFEKIAGDVFELDDEVAEYVFDKLCTTGSKVGGYAYFTQSDPRQGQAEDWLLLFQMDSSNVEEIDIMWGDAGVCNFFIEPAKLLCCDFSRVWYNWDCS
ncbi:YwqG family protein [Agaribacterium sp. ZY112]|uniref:YwqG family protein n=1 Tax=Agaribacterium sp. ZY112 TaxID=3233574 RepID=UPI0035245C4A